ncbi:hypothetical protein QFZ49_000803 [Streptomyces turgidiscabies]|uniref:Transposase n=1 Tax=Streptomyces turgidiscabies TaxID=85558 RepID=A0ABU0RFX5_9ACTN|nr:hypothetical protein [Streptomyces turgidiscabies]
MLTMAKTLAWCSYRRDYDVSLASLLCHRTHFAAPNQSLTRFTWEGQTNLDGELNVVHRP